MMKISSLAKQLGLKAWRDFAADILVLSGQRGTIVFNPRLRGIVVDDDVCFRGHRVVITDGRVSVPSGFVARCEERFGAAAPPEVRTKKPRERWHVVLDAGHGGRDPGAIGANGGYEKTVNLVVAQLVAAKLQHRGIGVTMTRPRDDFVELNQRAAIGNRVRADAFVSIHADAAENHSARGYTVFVAHTKYSDASRALLVCDEYNINLSKHNGGRSASRARRLEIIRSILAGSRARSRRLASLVRGELGKATDSPDRGTRLGPYRVLKRSVCPAVLVELGFMSNPEESRRLLRPAYREALASAIANGLILFLDGR